MERIPVSSTNIASVGYDKNSNLLEIEFLKNGRVYRYEGVPEYVYNDFMGSSSLGKYFNQYIKNVYPSYEVT